MRATATTTMPAEPVARPAPGLDAPRRPLSPRLVALAVVAETLLAAVLDVWHLGRNSAWLDETYTWSTASRSWSAFVHLVVTKEGGGILHSLLMLGWLRIDDGVTWMRVPSVVFAVATVPVLFLVVRRLLGTRVALVAGLLLALNGVVVSLAQEARTYSLMMLLATASFLFFVRVADGDGGTRATRVGWIVTSGLLVYTMPLAAAVVVAQLATLPFLPRGAVPPRVLRRGIAAIVVLWSPMIALQLFQSVSGRVDAHLEGGRTPLAVVKIVLGLSGGGGPVLIAVFWTLVCVALATGVARWRHEGASRSTWSIAVPLLWFALPAVTITLASYVVPNFAGRYFLMAVPGLVTAAALGAWRWFAHRWIVPALVVVVAAASIGLVHYYDSRKDDFRDATAFVLQHARRGDAVAFIGDEARIPFEYYSRDDVRVRAGLVPAYPRQPWGRFGTGDERVAIPTAAEVDALVHDYPRLWVVRRYDNDKAGSRARFRQLARGHRVRTWQFEDNVQVYLFVRPSAVPRPGAAT